MKSYPASGNCVFIVFIIALLSSCAGNNKSSENIPAEDSVAQVEESAPSVASAPVDSVAAPFTGTFEYSDPYEYGYLYYKIELVQTGQSVAGKFLAGNYLASNGQGYTNPNAIMECDADGSMEVHDGDRVMSIRLDVTKDEKYEDDAPYLMQIMNFPDGLDVEVTATIWSFKMENGVLKSSSGEMKNDEIVWLEWERVQ